MVSLLKEDDRHFVIQISILLITIFGIFVLAKIVPESYYENIYYPIGIILIGSGSILSILLLDKKWKNNYE